MLVLAADLAETISGLPRPKHPGERVTIPLKTLGEINHDRCEPLRTLELEATRYITWYGSKQLEWTLRL